MMHSYYRLNGSHEIKLEDPTMIYEKVMTDLNDRGLVQREGKGLEGSIRVRGSIAWRFRQGNEDKKDALSAKE
jgi:hypothetical protein